MVSVKFNVSAQLETSQWHFGDSASLSFLTQPPTVLNNSAMWTPESCVSMADASGNLLFYSDGVRVWNKSHNLMSNGTGLYGDFYPSQGVVAIRQPGPGNKYFIFTVRGMGNATGLCYSEVDMGLSSGQGSVTLKNTPLYPGPIAERICATQHCNGTDVWIVGHELNSNVFFAFLVTSAGVASVTVNSAVGPVQSKVLSGTMKFSGNGRKLAVADLESGGIRVFDFDVSTGIVSNEVVLDSSWYGYGCEFSPDGSKVYFTVWDSLSAVTGKLAQWDLCAPGGAAQPSAVFTATTSYASLQLALDGRIYAATGGLSGGALGVINHPDSAGTACGFVEGGQPVVPGLSMGGLPNIMTSLYDFKPPFTHTLIAPPACGTVSFTSPYVPGAYCAAAGNSIQSLQWDFGDPDSGNGNFSSSPDPVHTYNAPGTYTVKLMVGYACRKDTVTGTVEIGSGVPDFSVTGSPTLCVGESRTLSAVPGNYTYSWTATGQTPQIVASPTVTTIYTVTATNSLSGCSSVRRHTVDVLKCPGVWENQMLNAAVRLYPNPGTETVFIESEEDVLTVQFFDAIGRRVKQENIQPGRSEISVRDLPPGSYQVSFLRDGNPVQRTHFVKTAPY